MHIWGWDCLGLGLDGMLGMRDVAGLSGWDLQGFMGCSRMYVEGCWMWDVGMLVDVWDSKHSGWDVYTR